jgi:MATE family multidrug resistance protein
LTFSRQQGLKGLWSGAAIALFCSAAIGLYLSLKTNWDEEVQKAAKRLEEEERLRKPADEEVLTN